MAERIVTRTALLHELTELAHIASRMQAVAPSYAATHAEINELLEDLALLGKATL